MAARRLTAHLGAAALTRSVDDAPTKEDLDERAS